MAETTVPQGTGKFVRIMGWLVAVIGAVMVVAGGVTWGFTSSQLSSQGITVAAVTEEDPGPFAGSPVNNPWTAMAQANAINEHTRAATGGRTYAEIPNVSTPVEDQTDQEKADVKARAMALNGSLLQASLFTSVIAFGVALLVFGLGITFVLVGLGLLKAMPKTTVATIQTSSADKE